MGKTLAELKIGESGVISEIHLPPKLQRRLQEMGLIAGTEVTAVRKAPFGDPLEIEVRGYRLAFRVDDARNILMQGGDEA